MSAIPPTPASVQRQFALPEQVQSVQLARWLGQLPPGSAPVITQRPLQLHAVTQVSEPATSQLVNGATAFCQQMTSDGYSTLAIVLPVTPSNQVMQLMGSVLATTGSPQRKEAIDHWASQGLLLSMTPVYDRTVLVVNAKSGQEPSMVAAALDVLTHLPVNGPEFATEKTTLLKTLVDRDKVPGSAFAEKMSQALFGPNHPYALSRQAMFEQLATLQPRDVARFYGAVAAHPEQTQLVMISPLPVGEQALLLNQGVTTARWCSRPEVAAVKPMVPPIQPTLPPNGQPLLVAEESLDRAHLGKLWLGPTPADPDFDAFQVMTSLLGGMTGPLFRILRTERGLVYSTEHAMDPHQQASAYSVMAQIDFDKIPQAIEGLQEAVDCVLNQPPAPADLERVKREYVLQLRRERQQSADMAEKHLLRLGNGLPPEAVQAQEARILAITPEKIQAVANRFLGANNRTTLLGLTAPAKVLLQNFPNVPIAQPQHIAAQALSQALEQTPFSNVSNLTLPVSTRNEVAQFAHQDGLAQSNSQRQGVSVINQQWSA